MLSFTKKKITNFINQAIHNFIWGSSLDKKKKNHLVNCVKLSFDQKNMMDFKFVMLFCKIKPLQEALLGGSKLLPITHPGFKLSNPNIILLLDILTRKKISSFICKFLLQAWSIAISSLNELLVTVNLPFFVRSLD